jgi:purine-binding chemotaxis protein CheW
VRVEPQDVVPVSAVAPGTEHVAGLARLPDGVLVIQDLERFLSLDEGARLEAALASEAGRR